MPIPSAIKKAPDIAVLEVQDYVYFGDKINALCLPAENELLNKSMTRTAIVAGWGKFENTSNKTSDVLIEARVKVRSNDWCRKSNFPFMKRFYDDKSNIIK